jgi:type II secretory pathway component PulK
MKRATLRNQRGIAMMMALVTMLLLGILAAELVYESSVYNGVVFRQADQLRARLLARSGLRIALLQLRAAEKAKAKAKGLGLGETGGLTDQIWKTPLVLPPPVPTGIGLIEGQALDAFGKSLGLEGNVSVVIAGESSRLNLNQLNLLPSETGAGGAGGGSATSTATATSTSTSTSTSTAATPEARKAALTETRKAYADLIDQLLVNKRESDEAFRDRTGNLTGAILVGNLVAWMDKDTTEDGDGRDKRDFYARAEPQPYSIKEAPLASESELFMIKGFDESIAKLVGENFTTQPSSGVNVNEASALLLRALIPELSPAEAEKVLARRRDETQGGPFKDAADFWAYLDTLGTFGDAKARLEKMGVKILEKETSYRVVITAKSGLASKTWVAAVGPRPAAPKPAAGAAGGPATGGTAVNPNVNIDGNPEEEAKKADAANGAAGKKAGDTESLHILYLKAD